jgi:RNA polymerase sigma factor (sigma-70 family)
MTTWSENDEQDRSQRLEHMDDASSSLRQYQQDIAQFSRLTSADEHRLAQRIARGDQEARQHFINANLRLAVSIAKKYSGRGVDVLDLVQEANIGLIKAVDHFNPDKGCRFSTYAVWWMEERVILALSNQTDHLSLESKEATMIEIADEGPAPEEAVYLQQLNAHLYATFSCLTERERHVLVLRYGLDGNGQERKQADVAGLLKISVTRVGQLERNALRRMRHQGKSAALKDYWQERSA